MVNASTAPLLYCRFALGAPCASIKYVLNLYLLLYHCMEKIILRIQGFLWIYPQFFLKIILIIIYEEPFNTFLRFLSTFMENTKKKNRLSLMPINR
jgi:hypothetical protein